MKKLSFILCLCLLLASTACAPITEDNKEAEQINALLNEGKYADAYDIATDQNTKDRIIAENFAAYACCDVSASVESEEFSLKSGAFGKVNVNEQDTYTPNDSIFTMTNYQQLAEYLQFLTGKDFINDYYFGVIELETADELWYIVYSVKADSCEIQLINLWKSLSMTSQDDNATAFYKYMAKKVMDEGTKLENDAVNRVGSKYLSGNAEKIQFQYDLT